MQTNSAAPAPAPLFAEPTPLGLLGLAIGCGALIPVAFGILPEAAKLPMFFKTAAWFCLLFGAGGQLLAGLMSLANKNGLGGTLFTTFAFNWVFNWWTLSELAEGRIFDPTIVLFVDLTFLVIFVVLTYAFGFYSKLLFFFLLDIDLLYVGRIGRHFTDMGSAGFGALSMVIGFATVGLVGLALYIAFAMLVNPAAGRPVFPVGGAMFKPRST